MGADAARVLNQEEPPIESPPLPGEELIEEPLEPPLEPGDDVSDDISDHVELLSRR
jgi:hypothetical protein